MKSLKKIKIGLFLLIITAIMVITAGCARWPNEPGEPGETNYQLKITVEVKGEINPSEGNYYIVLDANENPADEPGDNVEDWEDDFYYVKLDSMGFYFSRVEEESSQITLTNSSHSGNKLQVTIAISDLEDPKSIDINIVTTDSDNNTYDSLDSGYFSINTTVLGSNPPIDDLADDSGDGGEDFDIVKVTAEINTL